MLWIDSGPKLMAKPCAGEVVFRDLKPDNVLVTFQDARLHSGNHRNTARTSRKKAKGTTKEHGVGNSSPNGHDVLLLIAMLHPRGRLTPKP